MVNYWIGIPFLKKFIQNRILHIIIDLIKLELSDADCDHNVTVDTYNILLGRLTELECLLEILDKEEKCIFENGDI